MMAVRHFPHAGHSPFVFKLQVLYRKKDAFAPEKVGRMKIKAYICLRKHRICFLRGVPVSVVQGGQAEIIPIEPDAGNAAEGNWNQSFFREAMWPRLVCPSFPWRENDGKNQREHGEGVCSPRLHMPPVARSPTKPGNNVQ